MFQNRWIFLNTKPDKFTSTICCVMRAGLRAKIGSTSLSLRVCQISQRLALPIMFSLVRTTNLLLFWKQNAPVLMFPKADSRQNCMPICWKRNTVADLLSSFPTVLIHAFGMINITLNARWQRCIPAETLKSCLIFAL